MTKISMDSSTAYAPKRSLYGDLIADEQKARIGTFQFFNIGLTFLLLTACITFFHIEESLRLPQLLHVLLPSFLIYVWLPVRFRLPSLLLIAGVSLFYLFGLSTTTLVLAGVGVFLFLTELPISWRWKVGLCITYLIVLILLRGVFLKAGEVQTAVTLVGVLLMFRSIVYLYELQHEKQDAGMLKRILYFLLPPNFIFYIFPIVDWKTFNRSFYAIEADTIYKQGLKWVFTGLLHLMFYRILYYYFMPEPEIMSSFLGVIQYMIVSYALIVRLSGLFHMSAGLLCLFGFNLPATFYNYFLVTNFSELWRRINIYWKDFVMKVFYFPIYFKFKNRNLTAVFITVCIVFFFNWLLHGYQWFWIRGTFLLKYTDVIFWTVLGLFVAINSVSAKKDQGKPGAEDSQLIEAGLFVSKAIGMFLFMSLLWSFWISPSVGEWWGLVVNIDPPTFGDLMLVLGALGGVFLAGVVIFIFLSRNTALQRKLDPLHSPSLVAVQAVSLILLLLATPTVRNFLDSQMEDGSDPIFKATLNTIDANNMFNGYYDELILGNNINNQLWDKEVKKPDNWGKINSTDIIEETNDIVGKRLKENYTGMFKEKVITTNSFGNRDKPYSVPKPKGVRRIALLGGSLEMGSGIANDDIYENIVENKLNSIVRMSGLDSIEIHNFSMSGIHVPHHVGIAQSRLAQVDPDVVIYTAHPSEQFRALLRFADVIKSPSRIRAYPFLIEIRDSLNISEDDRTTEVVHKLSPFKDTLYTWGLKEISLRCRTSNWPLIYLDVPDLGRFEDKEDKGARLKLLSELGYKYVDLRNAFQGFEVSELVTADYDQHPNEKGHELIAEEMIEQIRNDLDLTRILCGNEFQIFEK